VSVGFVLFCFILFRFIFVASLVVIVVFGWQKTTTDKRQAARDKGQSKSVSVPSSR